MGTLRLDLWRPVLLGLAFVIGVIVLAAGSAPGQPDSPSAPVVASPGAAPQPERLDAPVSGPVSVITTSQAFGY
jgi:hypothetical protein